MYVFVNEYRITLGVDVYRTIWNQELSTRQVINNSVRINPTAMLVRDLSSSIRLWWGRWLVGGGHGARKRKVENLVDLDQGIPAFTFTEE